MSEQKLWWWQWLAVVGTVAIQHGTPRRTVMPVIETGRRSGMSQVAAVNAMRSLSKGVFVDRPEPVERGKNRRQRRAEQARARGGS